MNTFKITYTGNDSRFKNLCIEQDANTACEAVIEFFSERLSDRYFPQDDGSIKDADGMTISESNQDYIKHDGGYFEAEQKLTYDIVFHDDNYSNAKGFCASLDYCKYYISSHNRSSNSYFSDYSGASVQIVCNETGQVVYSERIL